MLAKRQRLPRAAFTNFFKIGRRFHSEVATLIYSPAATFSASVVVGKKVAKSAVERNRYRRRVYEQIRRFQTETNRTGIFIVILKPAYKNLTREAARAKILQLLQKV